MYSDPIAYWILDRGVGVGKRFFCLSYGWTFLWIFRKHFFKTDDVTHSKRLSVVVFVSPLISPITGQRLRGLGQ